MTQNLMLYLGLVVFSLASFIAGVAGFVSTRRLLEARLQNARRRSLEKYLPAFEWILKILFAALAVCSLYLLYGLARVYQCALR